MVIIQVFNSLCTVLEQANMKAMQFL